MYNNGWLLNRSQCELEFRHMVITVTRWSRQGYKLSLVSHKMVRSELQASTTLCKLITISVSHTGTRSFRIILPNITSYPHQSVINESRPRTLSTPYFRTV
jgi:hypothetical protein